MSARLGNKTPAQTYNDFFYLNNDNMGIDFTARPLISGNGVATPLKLGVETMEADFNKGLLKKPLIDSYHLKINDIGEKSGAYQIRTNSGNMQKMTLVGNVDLTILSDVDESSAFEMTLLVEQSTGGHTLGLPAAFKTPSHTTISFSTTAGSIDILKFITYNGGDSWLVYKVASDMR